MKKLYCIILSIIISLGCTFFFGCNQPEEEPVSLLCNEDLTLDASFVKWEGRYSYQEGENNEPSKVNLYHSATGFTIDFTGTELYVEFESSISGNSKSHYPYYNVAVDDEILPNANPERTFKKKPTNARRQEKCEKIFKKSACMSKPIFAWRG